MTVFLVTYDLQVPGKDYNTLFARFAQWQAVRALYSVWFIHADVTTAALRDDLRGYIDANDRLLVTPMAPPMAWTSLMPGAAQFLQSRYGSG